MVVESGFLIEHLSVDFSSWTNVGHNFEEGWGNVDIFNTYTKGFTTLLDTTFAFLND